MIATRFPRHLIRPALAVAALAYAPAVLARDNAGGFDAALEISTRAVAAETSGRIDDDIIDGSSIAFRLAPSLSLDSGPVLLTFSNAATRVEYFADGRADRRGLCHVAGRLAAQRIRR